MRLWHYKLIEVLPQQMLVSQWREVIAIKRQWEKDTLKHRLVSYVKKYEKELFYTYVLQIVREMNNRKINYQEKYLEEIRKFCCKLHIKGDNNYPEHNDRYLIQCYYNLQEKYDRGIIKKDEWEKIDTKFRSVFK